MATSTLGAPTSYYHTTQSVGSKLIYFALRISGLKAFLARQTKVDLIRKLGSSPFPPKKLPRDICITCQKIQGSNVFTITCKTSSKKHIIYLHGGAFAISFARLHWKFMFRLAQETQCTIVAPDYPLSPEYSYKERFALMLPLYKNLVKTVSPDNISIMGDSSGGNFALSLAQKIKLDNLPIPSQVILLSPWLDVTMTNPEMSIMDKKDPLISVRASDVISKAHAGDLSLKHFLVSPLYGSLKGIGRISLFTGTYDLLNPDARKLKAKAESEGADFHYYEYKNMIHVWMLFPMPETKIAIRQIVALIRE